MKARYPSYMKHSRIWKFILLGLLIVILVPFGLFAYGNYMTGYYNGLDYPWRHSDTVWRSEDPRAEIAVDGDAGWIIRGAIRILSGAAKRRAQRSL